MMTSFSIVQNRLLKVQSLHLQLKAILIFTKVVHLVFVDCKKIVLLLLKTFYMSKSFLPKIIAVMATAAMAIVPNTLMLDHLNLFPSVSLIDAI